MSNTTQAQIGFYPGDNQGVSMSYDPEHVVTVYTNGHPTGYAGLVERLIDIGKEFFGEHRSFGSNETGLLAAHIIRRLNDPNVAVSDVALYRNTRFYYAVTIDGVHVYDARVLDDLTNVNYHTKLFFTSWTNDEQRRKIDADIKDLEARLKNLYLDRESVAMRRP